MAYSLEKRLALIAQVSNLLLAGSIQAYNDNQPIAARRQRRHA
jgi:hypothetical protein